MGSERRNLDEIPQEIIQHYYALLIHLLIMIWFLERLDYAVTSS